MHKDKMVNKIGALKASDFKTLGESWTKIGFPKLDNVVVYEDPYMSDDTFYKGKKQNGPSFLIVSIKISKLISNVLLKRERKNKLNKINEIR